MLGKLIKYEIPALGRKLVPLYIAWMATAVLLGIAIGRVESKSEFIMILSALLYAGVATAVFVMAVVMIVQRYNSSLLGDEGYFYHVLPVTADEHIACKTVSAVIWVCISGAAFLLTGIIIALFSGQFSIDWREFFKEIFYGITPMSWLLMLEFVIAGILSIAKSILAIYTALTIGHLANKRNGLASIGAYLAILTFEATVGRIVIGLFPRLIIQTDTTGDMARLFLFAIIADLLLGGIYFYICRDTIKKRLNLN